MSLKEKYPWLKHLDFIIIDLLCLIFSFALAFYIKMNKITFWEEQKWKSLCMMLCFINLLVMFFVNPYSGILKRRYYLQFRKEASLCIGQIVTMCVCFYVLKIGADFSREVLFTTFVVYFCTSQVIKYINKKLLTGEITILSFNRKKAVIEPNSDILELEVVPKNKILYSLSMFLKRFIDICAGLVGTIILIPLMLVVFILNRLNDEDGPLFFVQDRIGKNGKLFQMIKFRTMVVDADEKLEEFLEANPDIKEEFMVYRKIKNDPRVTKIGNFLRKTSLDEWPQFLNVLKGDMGLIRSEALPPKGKRGYGRVL